MSARSEQKMEAVKETLQFPGNAKYVVLSPAVFSTCLLLLLSLSRILPLDLSDPDECSSAAEKALALFGRVDILINNAGAYIRMVDI